MIYLLSLKRDKFIYVITDIISSPYFLEKKYYVESTNFVSITTTVFFSINFGKEQVFLTSLCTIFV